MARSLDARLKALKKGLDAKARALGVCPVHAARLRCVHEFEWLGSDEQLFEVNALAIKQSPGVAQMKMTGLACPICRSLLWCTECVIPPASPADKPILTPEEHARYLELAALLREKPPPLTLAEFMRQPSSDETAPAPPVPTPLPNPPVVAVPEVAPPPEIQNSEITTLNPPEVIDDAEDEDAALDTEIAHLMAEIQRVAGSR